MNHNHCPARKPADDEPTATTTPTNQEPHFVRQQIVQGKTWQTPRDFFLGLEKEMGGGKASSLLMGVRDQLPRAQGVAPPRSGHARAKWLHESAKSPTVGGPTPGAGLIRAAVNGNH